ncbi:uncharacterized protein METZ01_LOCUS249219, partial [marine metagenome]
HALECVFVVCESESNMNRRETKKKASVIWVKPKVRDLGKAKDLIRDVNSLGPGDSQFELLAVS